MVELGAGASPLVALAALRAGAARVVATDGSSAALVLLEANLAANMRWGWGSCTVGMSQGCPVGMVA